MQPSRREDLHLITGRGRYTTDWNMPGQLFAAVLRSPHPAARIVSLDTAPALELAGVKAVLTSADVERAGFKTIPGGVATKDRNGVPMRRPFYPVLAQDRVAYVGQAVAFVVAESTAIAQDAVERIVVEYEALPSVASVAAAMAVRAPRVHDDIEGNIGLEHEYGDAAATADCVRTCRAYDAPDFRQSAPGLESDGAARLPGGLRRGQRALHAARAHTGLDRYP